MASEHRKSAESDGSPSVGPSAGGTLTKSELITFIARDLPQLSEPDVELAVNSILERMSSALAGGERIEIRGFGSMTLHYRPPRTGRNPKTGAKVSVAEKYVPHFKPGAGLRKRVDGGGSGGGRGRGRGR